MLGWDWVYGVAPPSLLTVALDGVARVIGRLESDIDVRIVSDVPQIPHEDGCV